MTEVSSSSGKPLASPTDKQCILQFLRSPLSIERTSSNRLKVEFRVNRLSDPTSETSDVLPTNERESIETGLVIKSIGYTTVALDPCLPMDEKRGCIKNDSGKVLGLGPGLYCSGWAATGPSGVLIGTMNTSFDVAKNIIQAVEEGEIVLDERPGGQMIRKLLCDRGVQFVTFEDWSRIDEEEREKGKRDGKPREKLLSVSEMIAVAKLSKK